MAKAKQITGQAKFQVPGGQATPAPPVGTSLGKFGINLGQFVSQFNERTRQFNGIPIPVIVTTVPTGPLAGVRETSENVTV